MNIELQMIILLYFVFSEDNQSSLENIATTSGTGDIILEYVQQDEILNTLNQTGEDKAL